MRAKFLMAGAIVLCVAVLTAQSAAAKDVVHAVAGAFTKVDKATKTFVIKAADDTEHVFKYTDKTAVHEAKDAGKGAKKGILDSYLAGKEGTHVVVHYTGEGADKTAVHVEDFGKDALKVSEGTVTKVDKAAHTVSMKTKDGAEETYHLSKDAVIDTEKGVVKDTKEGEKLTVHYTEEGGKKIAHFLRRL
jgi:hypothetical protein